MPVSHVIVEKNIPIPMRDGVTLLADLYRPADGPPVPALVTRTPYDKEVSGGGILPVVPSPLKLAERGYGVVVCDCRGRFASEGEFRPFHQEGLDGYDTVEWAAAQSWADGSVGIFGPSYIGATTMLAAREAPPSLRCAIPIITADDYYDGWTYQGGAFQLGFAGLWGSGLAAAGYVQRDHARPMEHLPALQAAMGAPVGTLAHRPLREMPGISAPGVAPYWHEWVQHEERDDYWDAVRPSADYARFRVPMLHVGGWFDIFGIGTVRNFLGLRAEGAAAQHLVMGPWAHTNYDRHLGEMDFGPTGPAAFSGIVADYNHFLDQHLRGKAWDGPAVRYFLMGANEWRTSDAWPPPEARETSLFLRSRGNANSARGDGHLAASPAEGAEAPDRFLYDPLRPVPSEGGPTLQTAVGLPGPRDQRAIEARDDVLCYTSDPIPADLDVAGPLRVDLYVASDAEDTDFTAKLVDVYPDGRAVSIADGILRARFRNGFAAPHPLEANTPTLLAIDLASTAHRFAAGHRLRLEISSSNFPRFQAHPNTWGSVTGATQVRVAVQHVLHDADHPSALRCYALP